MKRYIALFVIVATIGMASAQNYVAEKLDPSTNGDRVLFFWCDGDTFDGSKLDSLFQLHSSIYDMIQNKNGLNEPNNTQLSTEPVIDDKDM